MAGTYLSVDLDFWCYGWLPDPLLFWRRVQALGLPILVVESHESLLPDINGGSCDAIINVDFHDDLPPLRQATEPGEDTWPAFVERRGSYEWRYPHGPSWQRGVCYYKRGRWGRNSGWKQVAKRQGLEDIPWDSITQVGLALSPKWATPVLIKGVLRELFDTADFHSAVQTLSARGGSFVWRPSH
jgi:hypothetical protein